MQRHDQHFLHMGCYDMITNHTIYVHRRTTSNVYFICKSRTNKTGSISRDTRNSRRKRIKKVTKVNESKQSMKQIDISRKKTESSHTSQDNSLVLFGTI